MKGITRYADVHVPMDEALTRVAIDVSGRPFLVFKAQFGARQGRRVRHRAGAGVVPGVRRERRRDAARRDALRVKRSPHCRSPASRAWRGRCARRSRSIRARPAKCPLPRARSAADLLRAGLEDEMPVYTVHEPPPRDSDDPADAADRFVFVRDKFSMWAFLFAPLWMVWRRLWLALLLYVVAMTLLQAALWALGASTPVKFIVGALVALLIGFEGADVAAMDLGAARLDQSRRRRRGRRGIRRAAFLRCLDCARSACRCRAPAGAMPYRSAADPPPSSACSLSRSRRRDSRAQSVRP